MTKQIKILFISAPIGSGHIRAAQSIQQALNENHPDIETKLTNVFDFFNPKLGKTILNVYLKILKLYPQAYGMAYGWGNNSRFALWGRRLISQYLANRMRHYIQSYNPSVIVCTHATPAGLVANLRHRGLLHIPAIGVVTDFTIHRLWIYPELTHYYVAQEGIRISLADYGIPLNQSSISGIPIMRQFINRQDKASMLRTLGLNEHAKTVLIMGGGAGIMPLDQLVQVCCEIETVIQLIVVAGHNQTMYNKLSNIKNTTNKSILLYGYTDNIHELMGVADLLISKPGGVSSAEALAVGLPLVIFKPIPGVEEANTEYLVHTGAAVRADNLKEVKELVQELLHNNQHRERMQNLSSSAGKPQAAASIAAGILSMLEQQ